MKILSIGEIIWDVYEKESFIGGAPLNFIAHATKCGIDGYLMSAVGYDELGDKAIKAVSDFNVKTDFIKRSDKKTGQCIVTLDQAGLPDYNVLRDVAYDNIVVTDDDIVDINKAEFDALYFGTVIQRNIVSRNSLKRLCSECNFNEIICDINLRKNCYDEESVKLCLENATILKISDEEEPILKELGFYSTDLTDLEDICKELCRRYAQIKYIIFTLGAKGSMVYCAESGECFNEPAKKVEVASTVGAGDSFMAAWAAEYLSGKSISEATKRATALSGFVVSNTDAVPDYVFDKDSLEPRLV